MEKITKEGWTKWLEDKTGPEMLFSVLTSFSADPLIMVESIFEYAKEVQKE